MGDKDVRIILSATDKTQAAFASAKKGMVGLSTSAANLGRAMGLALPAIGVAGLAAFAKSGIDAADSLNDMSQRLTVSVKDLASFKLAAEQSGTSLESVGAGIARLSKSIGQAEGGNKKLAGTLKELGITASDPKEAFFQLADAVQSMEDPNKRAALLSDVLGKSYGELVPLLKQGSDALRQSAADSESFADAMSRLAPEADKFNDNIALLKSNTAGFSATILADLVPALNTLFERYTNLKAAMAGGFINSVGLTGTLSNDIPKVNRQVRELEATITRLKKNSGGRDSSIAPLSAQLANLKKTQSALRAESLRGAMAIAEQQYKKPPAGYSESGASGKPSGSGTGRKKQTASPTDPLAGLLGQTDTAKAAEYEKLQGLLNARFERGAVSGKQYAEALSALRKNYFSEELKAFNDQLAYNAETEALVAEQLKATNDALYEQNQAWADAGASLEDELRTPMENANIEFGRLQELLDRGAISWETYSRAVFNTGETFEDAGQKIGEMDEFAKSAAQNMQSAFADFLFDPFDKGMDGMLKGFGQTIQRMIAEAASAQIAKALFGDLSGGEGGGIAGDALKFVGSFFANGGIAAYGKPVDIPRFAGGGISNSAAIFGEAGPEAAVPLPDGRNIPVKMMGGRGSTIVVNVNGGNNAPDVRRAAGQGAREALGLMRGAQRYA